MRRMRHWLAVSELTIRTSNRRHQNRNAERNYPQNKASMSSLEAEELARLKLELAQTRSRTDSMRLQARQLISQRITLKESAAKRRVETEEQCLVLAETMESINKLQKDLRRAEEEQNRLKEKLGEKGG
jgi:hypothetical protein